MLPDSRWSAHHLNAIYPHCLHALRAKGLSICLSGEATKLLGDAPREKGCIWLSRLYPSAREHKILTFPGGERLLVCLIDQSCLLVSKEGRVYPAPFQLVFPVITATTTRLPNISTEMAELGDWPPEWTPAGSHRATQPVLAPCFLPFLTVLSPSDEQICLDILAGLLYLNNSPAGTYALSSQTVELDGRLSPALVRNLLPLSSQSPQPQSPALTAQLEHLRHHHFPIPALPGQELSSGKVNPHKDILRIDHNPIRSAHEHMEIESRPIIAELRAFFDAFPFPEQGPVLHADT